MNIEELIEQIQKRPGMYVGCLELAPIVHFINGFMLNNFIEGRVDDVEKEFKETFHEWTRRQLESKYVVKLQEHRNYLFYINEVTTKSEDSLKIFFELCREFFEEFHMKKEQ